MTLSDIKSAVDNGKTVHYQNAGYTVIKNNDLYFIKSLSNGYKIGLEWADGTFPHEEKDFYKGE